MYLLRRERVSGWLGLLAVAVLALALSACSPGGSSGPGSPTGPTGSGVALTVFGAASLRAVLDEAKAAYRAAFPGSSLVISTDSSGTLAAQIELGAPADVFLSADTANPQRLVDKELTAGQMVVFAGNRLTVIVPIANPANIRTPADLARSGVRVIAAGDTVPISRYAAQVVDKLAQQAGYPAGFAAAYAANIRSKEDNVRAVVTRIELGEGDAAIVYVTDATTSPKVATVDLPSTADIRASYGGVVVKASAQVAAAQAFLDWFAGPAGQAILARHGFLPPG